MLTSMNLSDRKARTFYDKKKLNALYIKALKINQEAIIREKV
ncbi:hypothetical protein [Dapis sp. BLCC M172]